MGTESILRNRMEWEKPIFYGTEWNGSTVIRPFRRGTIWAETAIRDTMRMVSGLYGTWAASTVWNGKSVCRKVCITYWSWTTFAVKGDSYVYMDNEYTTDYCRLCSVFHTGYSYDVQIEFWPKNNRTCATCFLRNKKGYVSCMTVSHARPALLRSVASGLGVTHHLRHGMDWAKKQNFLRYGMVRVLFTRQFPVERIEK